MRIDKKSYFHKSICLSLLIIGLSISGIGQNDHPYKDVTHLSKVFGKEKTYRIYLPESYYQSNKRYPVIYFFHGWGGRYFKDDNAKLEYDKLGEVVNKYHVIMVMWDGSMDESEPRPYNIGYHQDIKYQVQMKDYLPELVSCIDSNYRTFTDRNHRGIIGFSMGGILSFYLAGKYPDKFSAAVNMVGSPEFFIGLPDNHTLYQVRYTFDNLRDVGLLFHNRDSCQMSGLNDEVNNGAIWSEMKNYEYHKLKGAHKVDDPGETKVFESAVKFICEQFENPFTLQKVWSHYDLCSDFSLWDFSVKSNKNEPGYIFLKNVDMNGFGFNTAKWLPAGPSLDKCTANIITSAVYKPHADYHISSYSLKDNKLTMMQQSADKDGRLHFELNEGTEMGIFSKGQSAGFRILGYQLNEGRKLIRVNGSNEMVLNLLNRDGSFAREGTLKVTLSCADASVYISIPSQSISLKNGQYLINTKPFIITCNKVPPPDGSPEYLRIKVNMENGNQLKEDDIIVPVFYDLPYFSDIQMDDGIKREMIRDSDSGELMDVIIQGEGRGNGDGLVSPGEQVMVSVEGHRLRLYTDDPFVIANEEQLKDEVIPAVWPDGYTLGSLIKIAEDCPNGHEIELIGHYEIKTYMPIYRQVKWGKVKLTVQSSNK